ncbi:glycosyltransferase [Lachnospiraceae bacterium JC7]|nr:glycosyltransferase [Lachnospiraceae bacterium JC7]
MGIKVADYIKKIDRDDISIHIPQEVLAENKDCSKGVLLFSHELSKTGAPIQMLELAVMLRDLGYQPLIFSLSEGDLIREYMDIGIPVICVAGTEVSVEWLDELVKEFDLIFINTLLMSDYVRYLANGSRRIFWWIHENSYLFDDYYCSNNPDISNFKILAASEKVRNNIAKYMKRESDILNVYIEDYGISDRKSSDKITFLWAGTIDFNKAPEIFIRAILCLLEDYIDKAEFIIVGHSCKTSEFNELKEILSYSIPNVRLINAVNHREFLNLMDTVDAVVITSIEESTSVVAVEGLMKGKVVICSEGCGVTKYIKDGENGFVFPVRDFEKLSEKLKFVIDNNENLNDLRCSGRSIYEKYYSFDIFRQKLKCLINDFEDKSCPPHSSSN